MWHKKKDKIICIKVIECRILKEALGSRVLYSKNSFTFLKEASTEGVVYYFLVTFFPTYKGTF